MSRNKIQIVVLTISFLITLNMSAFGFSNVKVDKIVFKNLIGSSTDYPALSGVRLYSNGNIIESGDTLVNDRLYGETDTFTIEASSTHPVSFFRPAHLVDTFKSQTCDLINGCAWVAGSKESNSITIDLKTDMNVELIEFVAAPGWMNSNYRTVEPFKIEVYLTNGAILLYYVTPVSERNIVQSVSIASILDEVDKVVFKDLIGSSTNYPALSGVRFYSNGNMIESGDTLVNDRLYGETDTFTIEASSTHPVSFFRPAHLVDTFKSQTCDLINGCAWVAGSKESNSITIDLKIDMNIELIEFVAAPGWMNSNYRTVEPFEIEVYFADGAILLYYVTPVSERNIVQSILIE